MSNRNSKIEVSCKDCTKLWLKRSDSIPEWYGRCMACSNTYKANLPEQLEVASRNGKAITARFGGVPNASKFSSDPSSPRYTGGELNSNWKGGITSENNRIRASTEYKLWRISVFKRDDYRCLYCGERGGNLEADHIYQFAYYPRLRLDINNGQTLCKDCHKTTPTYKKKVPIMELTGIFINHI